MNLLWLLVVILLVCAVLGAPGIGPTHNYGYYPSGGLGIVVVVIVLILLLGR